VSSYIPERCDLVWLEFNPQAGREQKGMRPALVLSPKLYNQKTKLAIFCPITNQEKGYPFEIKLPKGICLSGVVLSDQIKSLDWSRRKAKFICRLPQETLDEVLEKIAILISCCDD